MPFTANGETWTEYLNYPGQLESFSTTNRDAYDTTNYHLKKFWKVQDALTAAFSFENATNAADAFTTNVPAYAPTHYPLYRGFATFNSNGYTTFDHTACLTANGLKHKKMDTALMKTAVDKINANIKAAQSQSFETYFVYTHSAAKPEPVDSFYKPCNMRYESSAMSNIYGTSAHNFYSISNTDISASTARYLTDENGTVNDVNILDFGFIPRHEDIVCLLGNEKDQRKITFNAISASDIKHLLVIDDKRRPIFDVELDAEVLNNGYTINFNSMHTESAYATSAVMVSGYENESILICKSNTYNANNTGDVYKANQELIISANPNGAFSGPTDPKYQDWFKSITADHILLSNLKYTIKSVDFIPNSNLYAIRLNKAFTLNTLSDRSKLTELAVYNYKTDKTSDAGRNMAVVNDAVGMAIAVE